MTDNQRNRAGDLLAVLQEQFGHAEFRPGQERVIRNLLAGRDVLTVMSTGAGKSLVYQFAAQLLTGLTVVVTPLLALMKDQLDAIERYGFEVSMIASTQSKRAQRAALEAVRDGQAKLLYVTPERFADDDFIAQLAAIEVSLFV